MIAKGLQRVLQSYDRDKPRCRTSRQGVGAWERPPTAGPGWPMARLGVRPDAMPITNASSPGFQALASDRLDAGHVASSESVSRGLWFASNENYDTTLGMLFIGCRVCVRRKPLTCGEVVRIVPMTGRVIVRLDPPHPSWRGTLRSFRPERLVFTPSRRRMQG